MKKLTVAILFFLWCFLPAFSQRSLTGMVVNAATGEAIPGSSVFINTTSIGTTSSQSGEFILNGIPAGRFELIVSSIGYETKAISFTAGPLPPRLKVEMTVKMKELQNVVVEPFVEEGWEKWGKTFTDYFIGVTPNASNCRIRNEKAIRFRMYKNSNRLVAYADEPLLIENRALGYIIQYQLEEFEINFKQGTLAFAGYPYFEEIQKNRKNVPRRWERAREKAYYGSMLHFMRSVYENGLQENGYEVRRMVRTPNHEKKRVKSIYPSRTIVRQEAAGITVVESAPSPYSPDSIRYYERVLREKDEIDIHGQTVLTADSFSVKTAEGYRTIHFPDYLYITFRGEIEEHEYITFHGESRSATYQRSYIWLINQVPVSVDKNGSYYPPQELFSIAYWSWSEKISNMLPSNYEPQTKNY